MGSRTLQKASRETLYVTQPVGWSMLQVSTLFLQSMSPGGRASFWDRDPSPPFPCSQSGSPPACLPMMCRPPFHSWPPGCGVGAQPGACWLLLESSVVGDLAGGAGGGFSLPPLVPAREDDGCIQTLECMGTAAAMTCCEGKAMETFGCEMIG